MRYAIITGTGRSGTNWLLDTLDTSPETHCRNEPHGLVGTALNRFPLVWTEPHVDRPGYYRDHWDQVAHQTARRFGIRDHNITYTKPYLHPWSNHLNASRLMTGPRARRVVSRVDRRLARTEWLMPSWVGSQRSLEQSLAVLKILIDAPLLEWLLEERPDVPVVHIVRHPGGRLNSWLTRLLGPMNREQRVELHAHRVARAERIRSHDPQWAQLMPEPHELTLIELELWFWRYVNETKIAVGSGRPSYRLMRFDDLAADPVPQSEQTFRHVGLRWDETIRGRVDAGTQTSVFGSVTDPQVIAQAWRSELDPANVETIDKIMDGSPLVDFLA